MQNLSQSQLLLLQVCISLLLVDALWDLRYFGELVSYVTSYIEPTETKNKLGLKIRNLFKNCNRAMAQELELSGNPFVLLFQNYTDDYFKLLGDKKCTIQINIISRFVNVCIGRPQSLFCFWLKQSLQNKQKILR